jgi:hypothetical protein
MPISRLLLHAAGPTIYAWNDLASLAAAVAFPAALAIRTRTHPPNGPAPAFKIVSIDLFREKIGHTSGIVAADHADAFRRPLFLCRSALLLPLL